MNAKIIAVGKLREKWQRDACQEYSKRLTRYGQVQVVEVRDLPEPEKQNETLERRVMEEEGRAILKHIAQRDFVIALCINGEATDSVTFAGKMRKYMMSGNPIVFVIGGSLGLSEEVLNRADSKVSLSNMTFPHAIARVLLLEQLYRGARINANERYHK